MDKSNSDKDNSEEVVRELMSRRNARGMPITEKNKIDAFYTISFYFISVVVLFTVQTTAENILSTAQRVTGGKSLIWIGVDGWIGATPRDPSNDEYLDVLDGGSQSFHKLDLIDSMGK